MQTVNIEENLISQKNIINDFINKVRTGNVFPNNIFMFLNQIIKLECKKYDIEPEVIENNNKKIDGEKYSYILGCKYSKDKDITFYIEPEIFYKEYFDGKDIETKLLGIVEALIDTYCKVRYGIILMELARGILSPLTLEVSRELFFINNCDSEFLANNFKKFSFRYYGLEYAYYNILEILIDKEVLGLAQKRFANKELSLSLIGKFEKDGKFFERDNFIIKECELKFTSSPDFLYSFPIFERQYNFDGSEKNIHEIFEIMIEDLKKISHNNLIFKPQSKNYHLQNEEKCCKMFYYEIILHHLEFALEEDYNMLVKKYGVIFIQDLLSDMEKYFNDKYLIKLQYANEFEGNEFLNSNEVKDELRKSINSIVRFRNGVNLNPIAELLLREGGFIRGTREFLPQDILKRREVFANSLIGVYDAVESEEEYSRRAENEKKDIDEVINALYYNRFENFLKNLEIDEEEDLRKVQVVRMAQILKIVKLIGDTTKKDFFREFLQIPDVNKLIALFEKDESGYLKDCMFKSQIRIKKVIYPETEAENGKYKEYILGNELTEDGKDIGKKVAMLKEEFCK